MSLLKWYQKKNTIYMEGILGDQCDLTGIFDDVEGKTVRIDMSRVDRINSIGVLKWCNLISNTDIFIEYINCSISVIEQFNMVPEFLGDNSKVVTFYARYFCDECDKEVNRILSTQYFSNRSMEPPEFVCKCGSILFFDDIEEEYFCFLTFDKLNSNLENPDSIKM